MIKGNPSIDHVIRAYELRGLVPADPFALGDFNTAHPEFAGGHPNTTYWKKANGEYFYMSFYVYEGERHVCVDSVKELFYGGAWFAGVRNTSSTSKVE